MLHGFLAKALFNTSRGAAAIYVTELRAEIKKLPRWRWIRRLHLERQLQVYELIEVVEGRAVRIENDAWRRAMHRN